MNRSLPWILGWVACFIASACSSKKDRGTTGDPFVGFFAHPSYGMVELKRADGEGQFEGSMWGDAGPFPVKVTRNGNAARGTVAYGGASHPIELTPAPQRLLMTLDGTQAETPLQRYENMDAYQKSFQAQGGYQAEVTIEAPTTQPAR
jgi:hypothetical protein